MNSYSLSRHLVVLYSIVGKVGELFFFKALQRSLLLAFPLVIIGALGLCLLNLPFEIIHNFLTEPYIVFLNNLVSGTYGIASLVVLCCMSYNLGSMYNSTKENDHVSPSLYSVIALSSFFILQGNSGFSSFSEVISLSNGMFQAIFVAGLSSFLFHKLVMARFRIPVFGAGYDLFSMEIFALLPASILVILSFALMREGTISLGFNSFHELVQSSILSLLNTGGSEFTTGIFYVFSCQLLWFFGGHGPNILGAVGGNLLSPNLAENIYNVSMSVPAEHILNIGFIDAFTLLGGSGFTLSLLIAILLKSRDAGTRRISQLAFLVCLFNINEPLLFGIPLILNPVYILPFIFVPVIVFCVAYAATLLHLVPIVAADFHWTTPAFLSGYYATGGMSGVVLQFVNIIIGIGLYLPFVNLSDYILKKQYEHGMELILKAARRDKALSKYKCLNLPGFEGFVARSLANDLVRAIKYEQDLYLVYQPQVHTTAGKSFGAEALLRWKHPVFGHVSPEITVALAEDLGCIEELSYFVLRESCNQFCAWKEMVDVKFISVNFSPSLLTEGMTEKVMRVVHDARMPMNCLEIEITESVAISSGREAIEMLNDLRDVGIKIAIDDFGMGHTSLRYLREMPIDKVKIDRSLTLQSSNGLNKHIVSSILELCRNIDVKVIIEGVETVEQLENFREMSASQFQGYYFSRPISGEECLEFMRDWTYSYK